MIIFRYQIPYSYYVPTPGFLSNKNTPKYQRLSGKGLKKTSKSIVSEKNLNNKIQKNIYKPQGVTSLGVIKNAVIDQKENQNSFNVIEKPFEKNIDIQVSDMKNHTTERFDIKSLDNELSQEDQDNHVSFITGNNIQTYDENVNSQLNITQPLSTSNENEKSIIVQNKTLGTIEDIQEIGKKRRRRRKRKPKHVWGQDFVF